MHETLASVAKRAPCASPSAARRGDRSDIEGPSIVDVLVIIIALPFWVSIHAPFFLEMPISDTRYAPPVRSL